MSATPAISVIVPTRDRVDQLRTTLAALARQTTPPAAFEVIVVADGCRDQTVSVARGIDQPYVLVVLDEPHAGLAAARNRGARRATAPLLLFLDDDMEASPGFLAAHLGAHARRPGGVVLGTIPSVVYGVPDEVVGVEARRWWTNRTIERERPAHRFTACDVFGGNLSLPRTLFEATGGFDETFVNLHSAEDYELAVRLLRRRVPIQLVRGAEARHHDQPTFARALARAEADGRAHVLLVRRHAELLSVLPVGAPVPGRLRHVAWELGWSRPRAASLLIWGVRGGVRLGERWRLRGLRRRLAALLHDDAYWRGVRAEVGSRAAWDALRATATAPPDANERDYDLADGFAGLEALLATEPVDALRLRWRDTPIGRIPAAPAAEPLRAVHVRAALVNDFAPTLWAAMTAEESRA
jgi:GT2 family glycosyltransferase